MGDIIKKVAFPAVLALFGVILIGISVSQGQNSFFLIASIAMAIVGIAAVVNALSPFSKGIALAVGGFFVLMSVGLAVLDYKSISDPIAFNAERDRRYEHVIQNLKDIRAAQIMHRQQTGKYVTNLDTLVDWIKFDSITVIKSFGTQPDSITELEALELGIISRDTVLISVKDTLFSPSYRAMHVGPLVIDSLPYVPFTDGARFEMEAKMVEKNKLEVPVFLVVDSEPFDKRKVLQVGSITDPVTSGNWGE